MNTYKNLCKFEIYIKSIETMVGINATFECEDNDEMKKLVKDRKVEDLGHDVISDSIEEPKTKKKGKKKRTSEDEDKDIVSEED